jgi:competence protein ComEC
MDICDGNLKDPLFKAVFESINRGNFRMCDNPNNPIAYASSIGITSIFRFILSHPDMDHMDGFDKLVSTLGVANFWDTGARRDKPDFPGSPYDEADWDRYQKVIDGDEPGVSSAIRLAGHKFAYANQDGADGSKHDGLSILAPDAALINDPNTEDDINEGSYVLSYHSAGGTIVLPGDAHDASWEYVEQQHPGEKNCAFLLAPHHGRDSDRSYDFLDFLRPKLTLIGCTPSKYIDYDQWNRRGLELITSNQCGNVILATGSGFIDVYVQNDQFARSRGLRTDFVNPQGYVFFRRI